MYHTIQLEVLFEHTKMWGLKFLIIMFYLIVLCCVNSGSTHHYMSGESRSKIVNATLSREAKLFNQGFGVNGLSDRLTNRLSNRFQNLPLYATCQTQMNVPGICLGSSDCLRGGGTSSGVCWPVGVCCYTTMECNGQPSSAKQVFVSNNGLISGPQNDCLYTITPHSQNVGQLRIDFSTYFQSALPQNKLSTQILDCDTSYLRIAGRNYCGSNLKQHIYVAFSQGNTLNGQITVRNLGSTAALWEFTVTQIEIPLELLNVAPVAAVQWGLPANKLQSYLNFASSKDFDFNLIAPIGCDQYFLEEKGTVRSFNFNGGVGPYPPNHSYNICIRRYQGATGITLNFTNFHLGSNGAEPCVIAAPINPATVSSDYLSIALQAPMDPDLNKLQYCNTDLNLKTVHANSPGVFIIHFSSGMYLGQLHQMPPNIEARAFEFIYTVTSEQ